MRALNLAKIPGIAALSSLALALPAAAQDAEPAAEAVAAVIDKGDTTWMLVCTVLVIAMTIPGLALFYGGLVRTKNVLSILSQVFAAFAMVSLLWQA